MLPRSLQEDKKQVKSVSIEMEGGIEAATNQSLTLMLNRIDQVEESVSLPKEGCVASTERQSIRIMTSIYKADGNSVPIYLWSSID